MDRGLEEVERRLEALESFVDETSYEGAEDKDLYVETVSQYRLAVDWRGDKDFVYFDEMVNEAYEGLQQLNGYYDEDFL